MISKNIPKSVLSFNDFIFSMKNLIIYNEIKEQNIKRKDYISKAIINISLNTKENNLTWINYAEFKSEIYKIIEKENNNEQLLNELMVKLELSDEENI